MHSKIVTVEDVTKIVGINNYIAALKLDKKKLIYDRYERIGNRIKVHFHYEELPITIILNKEYRMLDMNCGCKPGLDYCPHIALAVMYLIQHEELLNQMVGEISYEYDAEFNQMLLRPNVNQSLKQQIILDINLKQIDPRHPGEYELQVKIGDNKKYVLKKHLEEFIDVYRANAGEVEFGQGFTYNPEIHCFNVEDTKIIEFIAFYVDSQNHPDFSFYGYHTTSEAISFIKLKNQSLLQFMPLLKAKPFTVEIGYYVYHFEGIEDAFPLQMQLHMLGNHVEWKIDLKELKPLTINYAYTMSKDKMYEVKDHDLLKLIVEHQKQNIYIQEEEMSLFSQTILPKIEKQTVMDEALQSRFLKESPTVKYYFEKDHRDVIAKIMLCYQGEEKNLLDSNNQWGDVFLARDETSEKQYQQDLFQYGFILKGTEFYLKNNDDILAFLEEGLYQLLQKYDVYVSKDLKDMKIVHHTQLESHFSLGKDRILSYQFQIADIDESELQDFLNSIRTKKKYYRLKNGNYVDLKQPELTEFTHMLDVMGMDLMTGTLPLYKSLALHSFPDIIQMDEALDTFLNRFAKYKDLQIHWNASDQKIIRDYQKLGIQWMLTISKCGFGGILADEMGLGKTLQTIYYMKEKLKEEKGTMLLIVPTSLLYNWEHELQLFGKELKYLIVSDTKSKRNHLFSHLEDYDVVLTTYGLLRQDIDAYTNYIFDTCILDEAQNIKNVNTETTKVVKQIKAKTRFALTGTPIENSILELWSIFDFLMPGFLSSYHQFKEKYNLKAIEEDESLLKNLNIQISPFILRRRKKDVLKELPDKIESNIYVDMTEEQKKLYLAELEQAKSKIEMTIAESGFMKSQILILSLLTRLRQICIDPRLYLDTNIRSGKLDALIEILKESTQNGHKILLFSQFPSALKLVQEELKRNAITSYYLDGSTPSKTRIELVDAFNQDSTNVFLISLKAGGTGLNLTSADIVIHLDLWWNPQIENQATDRSHRIGQKHVVEVIRLIAKGTIEEKILELQQKKKQLSEQVIEGDMRDQMILSKLTEEELMEILKSE